MLEKPIQSQFGQMVIDAFADFARKDLKAPSDLEQDEFVHISDPPLRRALAQVLYGVRWIYKLGLALLTQDEERAAHVRAQIVDYASITEGLLSHALAHAIRKGHTIGTSHEWSYPDKQKGFIKWDTSSPESTLERQNLWWLIRIATDFGVVDRALGSDLQWLRQQRNTVHLRKRAALGRTAFLQQSKKAFGIVSRTISQTKSWKALHH
jgi:hypothetical protein